MRGIKFRAWDKKEKKMTFLDVMDICYEYSCLTFSSQELEGICQWPTGESDDVKNQIIMQFTGLKDKNGKEIYEGDIVRFKPDHEQAKPAQVGSVNWDDCGSYLILNIFIRYCHPIEIIGNIYENYELLTK